MTEDVDLIVTAMTREKASLENQNSHEEDNKRKIYLRNQNQFVSIFFCRDERKIIKEPDKQ